MKISRESWHYRLFSTYANGDTWHLERERINFCQYSRKVLAGFLMTLVVVAGGVLLGIGLLQLLGSILLWMFTDNGWMWFILPLTPSEGGSFLNTIGLAAIILLGFEMLVIAMLAVVWVIKKLQTGYWWFRGRTQEDDASVPDGFFLTWYKSKKEKFCPVVTIASPDK